MIHDIKKLKNENHMIDSADAEKAFDKIEQPFMITTLQKVGIEGIYLNVMKAINCKPTANIIFSGEKLKAFPLRSGTRQGCPFSALLFKIVLEVLTITIRKKSQLERKENSLFTYSMILHIENPKDATRKLLELINEFGKVAGYKTNTQKSAVSIC